MTDEEIKQELSTKPEGVYEYPEGTYMNIDLSQEADDFLTKKAETLGISKEEFLVQILKEHMDNAEKEQ